MAQTFEQEHASIRKTLADRVMTTMLWLAHNEENKPNETIYTLPINKDFAFTDENLGGVCYEHITQIRVYSTQELEFGNPEPIWTREVIVDYDNTCLEGHNITIPFSDESQEIHECILEELMYLSQYLYLKTKNK